MNIVEKLKRKNPRIIKLRSKESKNQRELTQEERNYIYNFHHVSTFFWFAGSFQQRINNKSKKLKELLTIKKVKKS